MGRYNLIVLGGGSGGLTAAAIAALLGARVALLEKSRMGDAYPLRRATPRVRKFPSRCLRGCDVVHAKKGRAMARPHTRLKGDLDGDQALAVWSLLLAVVAALHPLAIAYAQSPLVAELETVATSYHHDPTRLDHLREGLEQTITTDPGVENLVALARVSYIWGDIRATTEDQRLAAYDRGRQVAKRAVELAPEHVEGRFWYALNTGRWGQIRGVMRSLFLLSTVQEEIHTILQLDPKFTPVYLLAGHVFYEVPRLLGGDLQKAEAMFRKGLEQDPRFTAMRVGLGKALIKLGRVPEGRRELLSVLEEKAPSNPADWALNDSKEARELLESLKGKW